MRKDEDDLDEPPLAPLKHEAARLLELVEVDAAAEKESQNPQKFGQRLQWR